MRFPEPLDRALLGRMLGVFEKSDAIVGKIEVGAGETSWRFVPDQPWRAGEYALQVGQALEDLAGNSIGRPFEIAEFDKIGSTGPAADTTLPFLIKPAVPSAPARCPQPR